GVTFIFTLGVSKGSSNSTGWQGIRYHNASCTVTVSDTTELPLVNIRPKTTLRKYNPSERMVLNGCAFPAYGSGAPCSLSTANFTFTWEQEEGDLDLGGGTTQEWESLF
ncbi:unnamed protein product, partial [Discosporangium mesarthrocarpum]